MKTISMLLDLKDDANLRYGIFVNWSDSAVLGICIKFVNSVFSSWVNVIKNNIKKCY